MSAERVEAFAQAFLLVAQAEGRLQEVEDDVFRFARAFEGSDELQRALADRALPVERRLAVIDDLTAGKALVESTALLAMVVAAGRASELPAIVDRFVELAAEQRAHEVAEVRTAVALDDEQRVRLTEALSTATGKRIELKVVVDPSVLGGVVARIGDTVIDGSVKHRIDQLKEQI